MTPEPEKMPIVLNLAKNGELCPEDTRTLDAIEPSIRRLYNKFIGEIISENKLTGLELCTNVLSRNTFVSGIHDCMCRAALLMHKLENGAKIDLIVAENSGHAEIFKQVLDKYNERVVRIEVVNSTPVISAVIVKHFISSILQIILIKILCPLYLSRKTPKGEIIMLDTFVTPNSFDADGNYIDRYYTGYSNFLSVSTKSRVWLAPALAEIKTPGEYFRIFKRLRAHCDQLLLTESWLRISDYIVALSMSCKIPFKIDKVPQVNGINYRSLIQGESKRDAASFGLIKAIGRYRMIGRFAKAGINLYGVINWHENQPQDRALNLGVKSYYPDTVVKGYQGYSVPEYFACAEPMDYENQAGCLPDSIEVIGEVRKSELSNNRSGVQINVAPAFRFSYLHRLTRKANLDKPIVLVVLPILREESRRLIKICEAVLDELNPSVEVIIKPHPTAPKSQVSLLIPDRIRGRVKVNFDSMSTLLGSASIMVSSASSACVEAMAIGIRVAILGNSSGVTLNPVSSAISGSAHTVFYNVQQLADFIENSSAGGDTRVPLESIFCLPNETNSEMLFDFGRSGSA